MIQMFRDFDYENKPVVDIVNEMIIDAIKKKASDIHFDPTEDYLNVRIRIDGELLEYAKVPAFVKKNLLTRIKIISGMNITESRLPQDGAIKSIGDIQDLDLRVSSLPIVDGEKIVIRILNYTMSSGGLENLGLSQKNLDKINKLIKMPNGIIMVAGATGSGKSTLINLIPRFYDVTSGEILVDGINVKDYQKEILNNIIGYVSQKAIIFSGTVKSNIKFGKSKNKISEKDILDAAKIAEAKEFVEKMEDTYNSHISQGGTNISGGQKQRLTIARALVKHPKILILDDSSSALDLKTDKDLRMKLKEIHDMTIFIISQRTSSLVNCDKILVLDKGELVDQGTHEELLKRCKLYQDIHYCQYEKEKK